MRIKLTLHRPEGRPPVDLVVTVDPETTVGALADHLARCDPGGEPVVGAAHTLARVGRADGEIDRLASVDGAGLQSGAIVALVRSATGAAPGSGRPAAVVLYVISGPDAGHEYPLPAGISVIGRDRDCEVRLSDPMASRKHAKLHVAETVEISDLGSVNGVLIGEAAVETATLRPGDAVRIGDNVLGIRFPAAADGRAAASVVAFNRSPRIQSRYDGRSFVLPDVPSTPNSQRFPIIPLFAPLLMGSALYLTTKSTTSLIFMAMSPLMMAGNVTEGTLAGKRTYRRHLELFRAAVAERHADVAAAIEEEAVARRAEHPSTDECAEAIRTQGALLWSRRPDLDDFGVLRLGLGSQPSRSKVEYPLGRQTDPALATELHDTFDPFRTVGAVPVVVDLDEGGPVGVAGPRPAAVGVARGYMVQLAALHSPAELAVRAICGSAAKADWDWLKWLPHTDGSALRTTSDPLASGQPGSTVLIGELEALVRARAEAGRSTETGDLPRVVLLVDDPLPSERSRLVELAERGAQAGVWILWVESHVADLPASCKAFVEMSPVPGADRAAVGFVGSSSRLEGVATDELGAPVAEDLARRLAPVVDVSMREETDSDIPRSVSLLSLVGPELAAEPERVLERWVENRSILSGPRAVGAEMLGRPGNLRALIGQNATGPHVLDLRVHGPHALVGGTTGAGKSEMLQSWIMAMALSNSPQRLTFLLVDYKGGSAFSDCVALPHTVGLVTDLSPHLVRRALTSLSAELRHRERILHRKQAKDLASLERLGDPEAPPSLVIVVDEFAALVKEVPEFVDGVVNVAQRGRSLGLHLILATQRPSGVIRDNLRANTNLRIALRMADVADSTDVIGSKLAAAFDPAIPGRAASRTGPTALVPFQTGYVGGWTDAAPTGPDAVVEALGFGPRLSWEPPASTGAVPAAEGPTDIQRLVATVKKANEAAALPAPRKPWLSELAPIYDLAVLPSARRDDDLVFAVADDPDNQAQPTVSFRPDDDGNMAVFGTGNSGKSTLLRSLAIAAAYTIRGGPCQVYGIDFGARGLQMLEQLPHVGSVIPGADTERLGRLLSELRERIERRADAFSAVGAGSITEYRTLAARPDEARILLLVDGMGAMRSAFEGTEHHRLYETFLSVASDGRKVGINVVLSADRAGAVPTALGALIQRRVVLRMAGENDYVMLGQPSDVLDPKSPPGRGLCDGREIQVAIFGKNPDLLAQDLAVGELAKAMRRAGATEAPSIRKLSDDVDLDELAVEADGRPVFAVAADTLAGTGFAPEGTFTVAGPPGSGRTTTIGTLVRSFRRWRPDSRLAYFGSRRSALAKDFDWDIAALDHAEAAKLAAEVTELLGDRSELSPPGLVVIENLIEYVQSPADAALQDMVRKVVANGHLVLSDGEPTPLSGLPQLLQAARASRVGIVLQPEQSDGVLFRAQFPRVRKADFPPGRGLYLARGGQPTVVQVAHSG